MSLAKLAKINHREERAPILIFIDEASMLGAGLLWKLLVALRRCSVRLILLGDPQQLPPIGWGSIFHQLLDSGEAFQIRLKGDWRKQDNASDSPENPIRVQLIEALDAADAAALANIKGVFFPPKPQQQVLDRGAVRRSDNPMHLLSPL